MIWIIIGLVISLWIWYFLIHNKGTKIFFGEWIAIILITTCAVSCVTLAADIITITFTSYTDTKFTSCTDTKYSYDDLDSSTKIIALKDRNTTEGDFFLGFGSVDNSDYYCYYTENDAGDIEFNKISTNDNVKLRYCSNGEQPNVKIYNQVEQKILVKEPNIWTSPLSDYLFYHKYSVGDVIETTISSYHNHQQTVIYIPEGSIEQNYKIDME